jgi:hypothetical protein
MSTEVPTPEALRILVGDPTDEEVAALLAVLAARASAGTTPAPATPASRWAAHWRAAAAPPAGPDGWRTSGLPR